MKNYLKIMAIVLLVINSIKTQAQWGNKWVLGNHKGLDFNNPGLPQPWEPNAMQSTGGNAILCDDYGQVLLYTDGDLCFNKLHQQMPNGIDLGAQSTSQSQSSIILPHPDGSNRYYIFAVDECYDLSDTTFCTSLGNYGGVIWAMVDMNLEGGLGDVVVKQQHLYYPTCSKITATRHCNGVDWWVVTKEYNTNRFFTYLVNATGINPFPVISGIGLQHPFNYPYEWGVNAKKGQMKVSSNGKFLGVKTLAPSFTQLFHFNNQNGIIYNQIFTDFHDTINPIPPTVINFYGEGLSFSPDNSKLYVSYGASSLNLIQYDISSMDSALIINSKVNLLQNSPIGFRTVGNMQIGPDNKLYFMLQDSNYVSKLSWLNKPNLQGIASAPSYTYLQHTNDTVYNSAYTPNFVDCILSREHKGALLIPNCIGLIDSIYFTDTLMNVVHDFDWDFGDPASGVNNTSTAHFPTHNFTNPGTYTITLIVQNDCDGYTVSQQVTIGSNVPILPTIAINGISLQSSNAIAYQWYLNNNSIAGATNQIYTPLQSGYYSVFITDSNGCMVQSQEFYFAVTNVAKIANANAISIIPNPATLSINIKCNDVISKVVILDMSGRIVLQTKETNLVNVGELNAGIYILTVKAKNTDYRAKFVKN